MVIFLENRRLHNFERGKMETYLDVKELSERIKMSPGTLRNLIWKKVLVEGVHYVKPTPRKILFVWSAVEAWMWEGQGQNTRASGPPKGLINI